MLCALLAVNTSPGFADRASGVNEPGLTVLCYHAIKDGPAKGYDVSEKTFRKQLEFLKRNGNQTISLEQFVQWKSGRMRLPSKAVLISFDDGDVSNYDKAYPVLKGYGFTATLFIPAGSLDMPGKLSSQQAREMLDNGFSIGSHGHAHMPILRMGKDSSEKEIQVSKSVLREKLGTDIAFFAYPYGYFNSPGKQEVADAGYAGAFTVIPGLNTRGTNDFELKRLLMHDGLVAMSEFRKLLEGDALELSKYWRLGIYDNMQKALYRMAEINARALLEVDGANELAREAMKLINQGGDPAAPPGGF